jgi:hypothetical protein
MHIAVVYFKHAEISPEDSDSVFFQNIGVYLSPHGVTSKRPTLTSSP